MASVWRILLGCCFGGLMGRLGNTTGASFARANAWKKRGTADPTVINLPAHACVDVREIGVRHRHSSRPDKIVRQLAEKPQFFTASHPMAALKLRVGEGFAGEYAAPFAHRNSNCAFNDGNLR